MLNQEGITREDRASHDVRERLAQLIRRSGEGYAALSRRIGRNPAYIQQFIKRGVPRKLSEGDRRLLALHFGVSESLLGALHDLPSPVPVSLAPDTGSAANHASVAYLTSRSAPADPLVIDRQFVNRGPGSASLGGGSPGGSGPAIAAHVVEGDSMAPTLSAGDHILVDTADNRSPRDGLYVIESDGALLVKRLSVNPVTRRIAILSDNAAYPSFPDCDPAGVCLVGRIFWMGRRLS